MFSFQQMTDARDGRVKSDQKANESYNSRWCYQNAVPLLHTSMWEYESLFYIVSLCTSVDLMLPL